MIKREDINKAVGTIVDTALTDAGIPAVRRRPDDSSPVSRRSVQISVEGLHIEPMGSMRKLSQEIEIYFYPADIDHPRDDAWKAADAIEAAFSDPVMIDEYAVRLDDEIFVDLSAEYAEISMTLTWFELMETLDGDKIEELELSTEVE